VELVAAQRADDLLAVGDIEGQNARKRILAAVTELRRKTRKLGESLN
jgi:hypothetical protein